MLIFRVVGVICIFINSIYGLIFFIFLVRFIDVYVMVFILIGVRGEFWYSLKLYFFDVIKKVEYFIF